MENFGESHRLYLFGHDYLEVYFHFMLISLGSYFVNQIADGVHKEVIPLDKSVNLDREVSIHQFEEIFEALETDLVGRLLESVIFALILVETYAICHSIVLLRQIGDYKLQRSRLVQDVRLD